MRLLVSQHNLGYWAAHLILKRITEFNPNSSRPFVIGLPTGSTPLMMYDELIKLYKAKRLSFKHVITFNLDEYIGVRDSEPHSFHYYMYHNFFKFIDIETKNINLLNGSAPDLIEECTSYEKKISDVGGIDLMILGVGQNGHIAFNEPGTSFSSTTHISQLNYSTLLANSRFFSHDLALIPKAALTMGIKTILNSREIVTIASGEHKSYALRQALEEPSSTLCPITALQQHKQTLLLCDDAALGELKFKTIKHFALYNDEYSNLDAMLSQLQDGN